MNKQQKEIVDKIRFYKKQKENVELRKYFFISKVQKMDENIHSYNIAILELSKLLDTKKEE